MRLTPSTYRIELTPEEVAELKIPTRPIQGLGEWPVTQFYIEWRHANAWAVKNDSQSVLNTDGDFEYEPFPSSRTDEFLARTRFTTPEIALEAFRKYVKQEIERLAGHSRS